jgi:hypothetical protein
VLLSMSSPDFHRRMHNLERVTLSFCAGVGDKMRVPERSGLNWGQRPGRDPNQAYLAIPASLQRTDFFPPEAEIFFLTSDDENTWACARRQANGKAIQTVDDNSAFGKYFRDRLGVRSGAMVSITDLQRFGRLSVDIYKQNGFSFFMDFSQQPALRAEY